MPTPLSPEAIEQLTLRRAGAKLRWYIHAVVFLPVNAVIFGMSRDGFARTARYGARRPGHS